MAKASKATDRAVVICTDKRGVFFGYAEGSTEGDAVVLCRPRMCVYWSADVKGVLGLAASGPTKGCRITAAPPRIELRGVTAVIDCAPAAVDAWESGSWA